MAYLKLSNKELVQKLQAGGVDQRLVNVFKDQNLAGRHLPKLRSSKHALRYGITFADLLDIEDCVGEIDDETEENETCSTIENNNSSQVSCEVNSDTLKTVPEETNSNSPIIGSKSNSEDEDDVPTDGNIFNGFIGADKLHTMDSYLKSVARQQIENYNLLHKRGIMINKPNFDFNSSPEKQQSKSSNKKVTKALSNCDQAVPCNDLSCAKEKDDSCIERNVPSTSHDQLPKKRQSDASDAISGNRKKLMCWDRSNSSRKPKKDIEEHLQPFLNHPNVDKAQRALIRHHLEVPANYTYDIDEILESASHSDELEDTVQILHRDGIVFRKAFETVLQTLVLYLYTQVKNPNDVNPDMREGLAVSLVASYPKFAQKPVREGDKPWTYIYDRDRNVGKVADLVQGMQRGQKTKRARGGGTERRRKKKTPRNAESEVVLLTQVPESCLSKETKYIKLLPGNDTYKDEIQENMLTTFKERRSLIMSGKYLLNAILNVYPQLKAYQGEMIHQEFRRMYEGKENNFLRNFGEVADKLVSIAKEEPDTFASVTNIFTDNTLNAMFILTKYLRLPSRCRNKVAEAKMTISAQVDDLIQIVPIGTNIPNSIETKREQSTHAIQPYLIGVGSKETIRSFVLVLGDSTSVQLPLGTQPQAAIDLLIKSFFVFNLDYCLGWKNVLRFVAAHIYKIPPENPRLSVFTMEWLRLFNHNCS